MEYAGYSRIASFDICNAGLVTFTVVGLAGSGANADSSTPANRTGKPHLT
jgi:hypothetical protein